MAYPQGSWSQKGDVDQAQFIDASHPVEGSRRVTGADEFYSGSFPQSEQFRRLPERGGMRFSSPSPTSSLSGAMGNAHISANPQLMPSGMTWPAAHGSFAPGAPRLSAYGSAPPTPVSATPSGAFAIYHPAEYPGFPNPDSEMFAQSSPTSSSPVHPDYVFLQQQARAMQQSAGHPSTPVTSSSISLPALPTTPSIPISHTSRPSRENEEIRRVRHQMREIEVERDAAVQEAEHLRQELMRITHGVSSSGSRGLLPTPLATPSAASSVMPEDWTARTEVRKKIYCSVNRAGNALCAWHDSRRERRVYPPRNAPPGMLNCGCTHEQALFEESLSRHGVGSYLPGESVRMDPALRNPLLELLQRRYGYQDGDFDLDPHTGMWANGEDADYWANKLASGAAVAKKNRGEDRR